eukprot:Rhum_TRINITY_DN2036_c0_g1::Rhum_TRINITY_DN2036_c0_g1_i1::g.5444::m.5444
MTLLSIRATLMSLSILLVVATGVIIGAIAITSGDKSVDNARQTGDEGVAMCLSSGDSDIKLMAGRYLSSVLKNVQVEVDRFFDIPEQILQGWRADLDVIHPNVSTSPEYINTVMRLRMRRKFEQVSALGVDTVNYEALSFSPAHPTPPPPKGTPTFHGWGGYLAFSNADETNGVLPTDGTPIRVAIETRDIATQTFQEGGYYTIGQCDEFGTLLHTPLQGYDLTSCALRGVRYDQGGVMGFCLLPRLLFDKGAVAETVDYMLQNINVPNGRLAPVNEAIFHPMWTVSNRMKMQVSLTLAHPEMLNLYPNQGNRYATMNVAISGDHLSTLLSSVTVAQGSLMYMVEQHTRTGEIGTLVAYSSGRAKDLKLKDTGLKDSNGDPLFFPVASVMHITNHTEVAGSGNASDIAQHGEYVQEHGGYPKLAQETTASSSFSSWVNNNGTEYWTAVSRLSRGEMHWYLSLLVPRSEVMEAIDASTTAIKEKVDKDRRDTDEERRVSTIVMIVVVCSTGAVLLVLAIVLTHVIVAPLHTLRSSMASVASMDLEAVDVTTRSALQEVASMQESFEMMVRNLIEYRNYMPQSVLVRDDETDDSEQSLSVEHAPRSHGSKGSALSANGVSSSEFAASSTAKQSVAGRKLQIGGALQKRAISIAYYNVLGWLTSCERVDVHELTSSHQAFVETALSSIQAVRGVCEGFTGDRLCATFNAFLPVATHKTQCLTSAMTLRGQTFMQGGQVMPTSFACASGEAKVGTLGCQGMKKLSVVTNVLPWVVALERYNKMLSKSGLCDQYLAKDLHSRFELRLTETLSYKKRSASAIRVYEVIDTLQVADEEWMYQLQNAGKSNPSWVSNEAWVHILKEEWDEADHKFKEFDAQLDPSMHAKLTSLLAERKYSAVPVVWH